jgi:regulator of PEP synthase PpsR (kinase-PPPase family)
MAKKRARKIGARPGRPKVAAPAGAPGRFRLIYLLSDSTGNLPKHMLAAFLTQFPRGAFEVRVRNFVRGEEDLRRAMAAVAGEPGMVLHALVSVDAKRVVSAECARVGVPACDLTGEFVRFLSENGGVLPAEDPAMLHHVDATYHRRIEAVEFAMSHDDGLGLETLHNADVVLCGVSRTSKTPTTMYLAQQGYLVGNVALAIECPPPAELLGLPREKVAGLVIDPSTLADIRTSRQGTWKMPDTAYNDPGHIGEEIEWSRKLFRRQGWRVIDVTNQAVEETAAKIVEAMGLVQRKG